MKYETFEKAKELRDQINYLAELEDLITCAEHSKDNLRNTLAVIQDEHYEPGTNKCIIIKCKVCSHITLTDDMKDKFLNIIKNEKDKLYREFKELGDT